MKYFLAVLILFITDNCLAQDEHFSQFYAIPMHMNPALTGAYDGTYRITAINRDQWSNKLSTPFRTFAAGGDTRIDFKLRQRKSQDKIGVGLFFISDRVEFYQTNNNKLSSYFAYHKRLGKNNVSYLGGGIKLGIIQRNINYDNLIFEDEFNQVDGYDWQSSEVLPPNNFGNFDISTGINYYLSMPKSNYYVGAALHHLTEPSFSFFKDQATTILNPSIDISQKLYSKIVVHVGMDRQIKYSLAVQPRIIYQKQGEHNQIDFGSNLEYTFKSREDALIIGLWLTAQSDLDGSPIENITPLVGLRRKNFILGFSYDIHMKDALDGALGFNTFEFSLRFSGVTEKTGAYCPTF